MSTDDLADGLAYAIILAAIAEHGCTPAAFEAALRITARTPALNPAEHEEAA